MHGWIECWSSLLAMGLMMALVEFFERILVGISCRLFRYLECELLVQLVPKFAAGDSSNIGKALLMVC